MATSIPKRVDPRSFLTWSELRRITRELCIADGQRFIDLGCGHGGPGAWVARETGASLVGIDLSESAIADAPRRAAAFGLTSDRHEFRVGDICKSGLPTASLDGYLPPLRVHAFFWSQPASSSKRMTSKWAPKTAATDKLMFEARGTLGLTDGVDYLRFSQRILVVARRV
jgi:SAM-dependent methyltransferase